MSNYFNSVLVLTYLLKLWLLYRPTFPWPVQKPLNFKIPQFVHEWSILWLVRNGKHHCCYKNYDNQVKTNQWMELGDFLPKGTCMQLVSCGLAIFCAYLIWLYHSYPQPKHKSLLADYHISNNLLWCRYKQLNLAFSMYLIIYSSLVVEVPSCLSPNRKGRKSLSFLQGSHLQVHWLKSFNLSYQKVYSRQRNLNCKYLSVNSCVKISLFLVCFRYVQYVYFLSTNWYCMMPKQTL